MRLSPSAGFSQHQHQQQQQQQQEGERRCLNSELWHACAGPLVSLPTVGSRVVYFAQGHSEQVAASTNNEVDAQIPNYPSLPPQLICQLHNVTMHADSETDEVYAQMTLQPLNPQEQKDVSYIPSEYGMLSRQPTNYFCKTLTASDTSTHGGFSVPRRAAEKVFPPLDFTQQPPAQELIARDLHENEWKFRHIFRGQPKRHLLTTGWSVFVSAKRLIAGDSVLFIWNEKNQLLLGIRRATRPQTVMPSSVLSSDSMHLGLLAAAAHAATTNSRFTVFYNPRASPSEFVIPLEKYIKALYHTRVSVGMRFRMLFETEESSVRRYMGTITGICDLNSPRWPNSHWRSVKVGWDESTAGDRQPRVSLWEIEPLTTFPMYPSPFPLRLKRPWPPGLPSLHGVKDDSMCMSPLMWLPADHPDRVVAPHSFNFQGIGVSPWVQQPRLDISLLPYPSDLYPQQQQQQQTVPTHSKIPSPSSIHFNHHHSFPSHHSPQFQEQLQQQQHHLFGGEAVDRERTDDTDRHEDRQVVPSPSLDFLQFPSVSPLHTLLGSFPQEEPSQLFGFSQSNSSWFPKRAQVLDPPHHHNHHLGSLHHTVSLPPFPGRECSVDDEGGGDPSNHLLFGVSIEPPPPPLLVQNGISSSRAGKGGGGSSESDRASMSFSEANYISSTACTEISGMTPSTCMDDSPFLHSPDNNLPQPNPPPARTFVKVHKSGSFGRSLDMSKFSSYSELRSELARMFGLQGELEDQLRSGWQLVFVDRENDVLLLGDDPWQEFVNSVWCIKILSPQEVQQMGKRGLGLLSSVPMQKLSKGCVER